MKQLVLASASPRRRWLFEQMNLSFIVHSSGIDESVKHDVKPDELVRYLAKEKGLCIAKVHSDSLIVAADTIVYIDREILGKPQERQQAIDYLTRLSGRKHEVISGVFTAETDVNKNILKSFSFFERTIVEFSTLDKEEIEKYVDTYKPYDKAGAYGIQDDFGAFFVKGIEGDFNNVVGFPKHSFYHHLKRHYRDIFDELF